MAEGRDHADAARLRLADTQAVLGRSSDDRHGEGVHGAGAHVAGLDLEVAELRRQEARMMLAEVTDGVVEAAWRALDGSAAF